MPSQPDAWTLQPRAAGSRRAPSYGPSRPAAPVASSSWPPVVKYYDGKYSDYFHRFMPRHRLIHIEEINLKYHHYRGRICAIIYSLYTIFQSLPQINTDCGLFCGVVAPSQTLGGEQTHKATDFAFSNCKTKYVFVRCFDDDGLF